MEKSKSNIKNYSKKLEPLSGNARFRHKFYVFIEI